MSRVEAREVAFCLLFERSYNIRTAPENYRQLFGDVELTDADMEYITRVLAAYDENRGEIDAAIEKKPALEAFQNSAGRSFPYAPCNMRNDVYERCAAQGGHKRGGKSFKAVL